MNRRVLRLKNTIGLLSLFILLPLSSLGAVVTVVSASDSGAGSLRQAVADAAAGDTIVFDLAYPATIALSSPLAVTRDLTLRGPGAQHLTLSGNAGVRVLDLTGGTLHLARLTVADGAVSGWEENGAGIRLGGGTAATLDQCRVMNHALSGGSNRGAAFHVPATASLTVLRSTICGNSVPMDSNSEGGAFYSEGDLTVSGCTVASNSAHYGSALFDRGGAGRTTSLLNTTFSANHSGADGAVCKNAGGSMSLVNCTVTANVSSQYEAGLYAGGGGTLQMRNTVIAGNLPADGMGDTDLFFDTAGIHVSAVFFTSQGYNLIGSTGSQTYTWTTGDVVGTEAAGQAAGLAPLADNGGYVATHAPNAGSPAINPASANNACFVDGRGYLRSGTADKGASEYGGTLPAALAATAVATNGFTARWTVVGGAAGYLLDVATDSAFTDPIPGYDGLDVGNVVACAVSGLPAGTRHYYRIRGYQGIQQTYSSNTETVETLEPPPPFTVLSIQ